MRHFLIIISYLISFYGFSQTFRGVIIDKDNNTHIEGANIYILNPKKGVVSDNKGRFTLKLDLDLQQRDSLYISHLSYESKTIPINALKGKRITIGLSPKVEELENIEFVTERKLNPKVKFETLANIGSTIYAFGSTIDNGKIYISGGDFSVENDALLKTFQLNAGFMNLEPSLQEVLDQSRFVAGEMKGYRGLLRVYDIKNEEWKDISTELRKRAYHTLHAYNNKLYIIGGKRLSDNAKYEYLDSKIEIVDLTDNSIIIDNTNPHQAVNPGSFLYKDRIVLLGGSIKLKNSGYKVYSDKIHSLNLKTGLWYEIGNTPFKGEMNTVLLQNKLYVVELASLKNNQKCHLHVFDLNSGEWKSKGQLPKEMKNPAIVGAKNTLYFLEDGRFFTFDTKTSLFREYLTDLDIQGATMHYYENALYILGGYKKDNISLLPSSQMFRIDLEQLEDTKINMFTELSFTIN